MVDVDLMLLAFLLWSGIAYNETRPTLRKESATPPEFSET
jgi:hypothetical protein